MSTDQATPAADSAHDDAAAAHAPPAHDAHDAHDAHEAHEATHEAAHPADANDHAGLSATEKELMEMRDAVLTSAELANRSAHTATSLGMDLKDTTKSLQSTISTQNKKTYVLFGVTGTLLVFGALVFGTMTFTLKARLNQLDEMLGAMSKRVGELNEALEVVGSVNEGLQEMVAKQAGIASAQAKLEVRINEMMASAQNVPELTAKQIDAKGQVLAKQVQSLEGRMQSQAQALQSLGSQMQGLKAALGDTGGLKREMEALAKIQRERAAAEAGNAAQNNQAKAAAEAAALAAARQRERERMVQYPRVGDSTPTPGAGVLNTK